MTIRHCCNTAASVQHGLYALAVVVLCSCGTVRVPDLHMQLPASWRNQPSISAATTPDLRGWWHAFDDPQLDTLVNQALQSNLDVAEAVERLRAERASYNRTDAPFLPTLHLRTDDPVDPDAIASYFIVGFDAQWELGLFGRREAVEQMAQGNLYTAWANLRQARVSLVAEVVRNWIDLRANERSVRVLEQILDAQRRNIAGIAVRKKLRLAAPDDLAMAKVALARTEASMSAPRQQVNEAAQMLALLLGRSEPDPAWLVAGDLPNLGESSIAATPADLLRTRPEIATAEARVLQAAGALGIARSRMYPNIAIGGSLVWSSSTLTHKESEFNAIGSLGPIIDIPLFDWGLREAQKHARSRQLRASVLAYRKAVLTGVAEVETALGNLAQQRAREQASQAIVRALDNSAAQHATRQQLGLESSMELNNSSVAREQAELELIDARAARGIAYVALYKALGGAPVAQTDKLKINAKRMSAR